MKRYKLNRKQSFVRSLLVGLSILFFLPMAEAATLNVPADYPTIQSAIDAASNGDTVLVEPGTYMENINFNGKSIVVGSLFLTTGDMSYIPLTVIDGGCPIDPWCGETGYTVVKINSGESSSAVLQGFTVQNGRDSGAGGISINSSAALKNLIVKNNRSSGKGGGIRVDGGSPSIESVVLDGNTGANGGGIAIATGSNVTIKNSSISHNSTDGGNEGGGGIFVSDSTLTLMNTTVSDNNLTLSEMPDAPPVLIGDGGGLFHRVSSTITITNSIFWGNQGDNQIAEREPGGTVTVSYSDIQEGYVGTGNINSDPLFVDPTNGDYHLQANSPCIDTGTPLGAPLTDIEGTSRPKGAEYDMGAYEAYLPVTLIAYTPDPTNDKTPTLNWNDVVGASTYTLQYSQHSDFASYSEVTGLTQSTYTIPVELSEGTWYWRVRAIDSGDVAGWWSAADSFVIDITPPIADAGPNQTVGAATTVTLNGLNSSDNASGIDSYQWEQTQGISVALSDSNVAQPTFTAPGFNEVDEGGESLTFQLTVTDNAQFQSTDTCIVNVTWDNDPPIANAGPDQAVEEGTTVTLDGSNSTDPDDGIGSYLWIQTAGTTVTLDNASVSQPTFAAPNVIPSGETLTFQLTVTDNHALQSTDTCNVNVTGDNDPPTANAGPDQTVEEGTTVTLDGSNSTDPDDGIHRYLWTQTVGTPTTLSDASAVNPTFVTPPVDSAGTHLEFLLAVIDNGGLQHTDLVSVDVEDNGIGNFPDDVCSTESPTGRVIGFRVESGGAVTNFLPLSEDSVQDTANMPSDFIYGLIAIQIKPDVTGGTVVLTYFLEESASSGYSWYKYGPNKGWYNYGNYSEFNANRDQVTLTLVDGGIGDDDGVANGVIIDPSGLGMSTGSGGGGGSGGCFIDTAAYGFPRAR